MKEKVPVIFIETSVLIEKLEGLNEAEIEWFDHLMHRLNLYDYIVGADRKEKKNGIQYKIKSSK